jgi:hypothetical protein
VISKIGKKSEHMVNMEQKFMNRKVVNLTLDMQKCKAKKKLLESEVYEPLQKAQTIENKQLLTVYDCNIQNSSGNMRVSQWVITDYS